MLSRRFSGKGFSSVCFKEQSGRGVVDIKK